eukprot:gnl/TRDRNA2_/TRDRNA2_165757_c3_seq1.p2 gnl/TRDRNA2_/TRDRNA2_165757_c3~~gnl/TRDRNA2_/TRDRNA2_165757_c3_seq1.p2  ORF type:complete len:114 (+),score=5.18 gnl/TRDRNA2_/TRDRNA2_165757_c3_seq1:178-519(+)
MSETMMWCHTAALRWMSLCSVPGLRKRKAGAKTLRTPELHLSVRPRAERHANTIPPNVDTHMNGNYRMQMTSNHHPTACLPTIFCIAKSCISAIAASIVVLKKVRASSRSPSL